MPALVFTDYVTAGTAVCKPPHSPVLRRTEGGDLNL